MAKRGWDGVHFNEDVNETSEVGDENCGKFLTDYQALEGRKDLVLEEMRSVLVYWTTKTNKEFGSKYLKKILSFGSSFSEDYLVLKALLVQDSIRLSSWCSVCCNGPHDPMGHDVPQSPKGDTSPGLHVF